MSSYRQNCPARGNNCGIKNNIAKVCRKSRNQIIPKTKLNNVEDASSEAATVEERLNQIGSMIRRKSIHDANNDPYYDDFGDNCVAVISCSERVREVEPGNMYIKIENTETEALVDSGSVCTKKNKNSAIDLVMNSKDIYWKNTHYSLYLENRIKFDASTAGLGAALEQPSPTSLVHWPHDSFIQKKDTRLMK